MASCVPTFASCHFGKNLATKTNHKTTNIMAPITQQGSCGFASPPPPSLFLQRNGVTTRIFIAKRSAKIVAMAQVGAGPKPKSTNCQFSNNTSIDLIVKKSDGTHVWAGDSISSDFSIPTNNTNSFLHKALGVGSIGGIVLTQSNSSPDVNWIVAWSNKVNTNNQVYILVASAADPVNWEYIKAQLDSSTSSSESHTSKAVIDSMSDTPLVTVTLKEYAGA